MQVEQNSPEHQAAMQALNDAMLAGLENFWDAVGSWPPQLVARDGFMAAEVAMLTLIAAHQNVSNRVSFELVDVGATHWLKQRSVILAMCQEPPPAIKN